MQPRAPYVAIAVVVLAALASARQAAQAQAPAFRSGIDLIAVDAEVFDKNGKPVEGLSPDKFEVKVGGKTRRVVSATFVDYVHSNSALASTLQLPGATSLSAAPTAGATSADRPGRLFVLVVDASTFSALEARPILVAAKSFVATLQPDDRVGLLSLPTGPALEPTTDRAVVVKALDDVTGQKTNYGASQFALRPSELVILANVLYGHPDGGGSNIVKAACGDDNPGCASQFVMDVKGRIAEEELRVANTAENLRRLMQGMADIPGRKHVVLVSAGQITNDRGGPRLDIGDLARQSGQWAARANATIDSLFIDRSMTSSNLAENRSAPLTMTDLSRDRIVVQQVLDQYADASGGSVFPIAAGAGEFAFNRIALQTSAFYLLGVEAAESDKDGKPHELSVKVNAPGATIRARRWFSLAGPDAPAARDPFAGWDLSSAAEPLRIEPVPFKGTDSDGRAAVALIAGRSAAPNASAESVEIVVVASAAGTTRVADQQRALVNFTWTAAATSRDYDVLSRLMLAPGRYEVRVGARMDGRRAGVTTTTIDVPDFVNESLSLSGLTLFSARKTAVGQPDVLKGLLLPSAPTTRRSFGASDRVKVFVRVYQGQVVTLVPTTITMTITDAQGKAVADDETTLEASAFAANRSADFEADVPVQDLAPGTYRLAITAKANAQVATRTLAFAFAEDAR